METQDVYGLIHSLTPTERRYFRIQSVDDENKIHRYFSFYSFILEQNIQSDEQLRKHPQGKDFYKGRNLSMEKKRLKEKLFAALADFDKSKNPTIARRYILAEIEALESRAHLHLAMEHLQTAKAKGLQAESWAFLLEINTLEIKFAAINSRTAQSNDLNLLKQERTRYLQNLTLDIQTKDIWENLLYYQRSRNFTEADLDIQTFNLQPLLAHPNPHYHLQLHLFMNQAILALLRGRSQEAHLFYRQAILILHSNSAIASENPRATLLHYYNYLNLAHANSSYQEFPEYIKRMELLERNRARKGIPSQPYARTMRLIYLANTGQIEAALEIARTLHEEHPKPHADLPNSHYMASVFNLFILQFLAGRTADARQTLKAVLNDRSIRLREDLRDMFLVFETVMFFESHEWDLVEARYRALDRRNWQDPALKTPISILLNLFRKYTQDPNARASQHLPLFQDAATRLSQVRDITPKLQLIGWREICLWVEAKAAQKTITEIIATTPTFSFSPLTSYPSTVTEESEEADQPSPTPAYPSSSPHSHPSTP